MLLNIFQKHCIMDVSLVIQAIRSEVSDLFPVDLCEPELLTVEDEPRSMKVVVVGGLFQVIAEIDSNYKKQPVEVNLAESPSWPSFHTGCREEFDLR